MNARFRIFQECCLLLEGVPGAETSHQVTKSALNPQCTQDDMLGMVDIIMNLTVPKPTLPKA